MSTPPGRSLPLSRLRRVTRDYLGVCQGMPTVTIGRVMHLQAVAHARAAAVPRPSWSAIFTKAYALAAAPQPALRRSFLTWPRARLHEHPENVAGVVVEREVHGEPALLLALLKRPETAPLAQLDGQLGRVKHEPLEHSRPLRRLRRLGGYPRPLRRLMLWLGLNVLGRQRVRHFGTFGVTTVAGLGADSLRPLSSWTTLLHYGVVDAAGLTTMRLTFDHRVLDGSIPAQALADMQRHLTTTLLDELLSIRGAG